MTYLSLLVLEDMSRFLSLSIVLIINIIQRMSNTMTWLRAIKRTNPDGPIEEVFFRAILLIALVACLVSVVFDLSVTTTLSYIVPANLVFIVILLFTMCAINKIKYQPVVSFSLVAFTSFVFIRGILYPQFYHVTCTFLICIGFMSALTERGRSGKTMRWAILASFVIYLFRDLGQVYPATLVRQALPYIMVYSIIAILTGLLKQRYEKNHTRLLVMVDILNKQNSTINEQHVKLQASYKELSDLNRNLAIIVKEKTNSIAEKNRQLAQIAYENSHCIRAPLARLLGLLHLIEIDPAGKDFYLSKLDDEAFEMDDRIRTLVRSIEKNLHE